MPTHSFITRGILELGRNPAGAINQKIADRVFQRFSFALKKDHIPETSVIFFKKLTLFYIFFINHISYSYILYQNGNHFNILLFVFKSALLASFNIKYYFDF